MKRKKKDYACRVRKEKERLYLQGEEGKRKVILARRGRKKKGYTFRARKEKEMLLLQDEKGTGKVQTCRMRKEIIRVRKKKGKVCTCRGRKNNDG